IEKMYLALKIGSIHPNKAHKSFAKLPFQLVATTNFDYLLEETYSILGNKFCRTIIDEEQLPIINNDPKHLNLLKIHGDLGHPSRLVATEEDYDAFINQFPMIATFITNLFISKTVFFIGYSVDDSDIRQIFQMIKNRLGKLKRRAYTLRINSSIQEINRFARRGINVINIPINLDNPDYDLIFSEIFEELSDYWSQNIPNKATEEDSELDLVLSKLSLNKVSRLCYFAVDYSNLPYYKSNIFPILYNYGINAVTTDDFIDSNGNYFARIKSLINISNICIADLTSNSRHVISEIEIIIDKIINSTDKFHLILIKDKATDSNPNEILYQYLSKINSTTKIQLNSEIFNRIHYINFDKILNQIDLNSLESLMQKLSNDIYENFDKETNDLLKNGQYDMALLTGYISLERAIRGAYHDSPRYYPTIKLFEILVKTGQISTEDYDLINEARILRNLLAHGQATKKLTKSEVTKFLKSFEKIKDNLKNYK
ncbi:MAG: SIR2 family protein, partial [Bacilli bacterium]